MVVRKMGATALILFMIATAFTGLVYVQPMATANSGTGASAGWYYWVDNKSPDPKITYNWINITSDGTIATLERGTSDEGFSYALDIGFPFTFFNTTYTKVRAYTNGFLEFHLNISTSNYYPNNVAIPNTGNPNNMTAIFWDDLTLLPANDAKILYKSDTVSSPKKFIVQYVNVTHTLGSSPMTFEAILYEDGSIVYQYETMGAPGSTYSTGSSATVGIENGTGASGLQYSYNTMDAITSGLAIKFAQTGHDVAVRSVSSLAVKPGVGINIDANVSNYRPVDESNVGVFFNITDAAGVELGSYSTLIPTLAASTYQIVTWSTTAPVTPGDYKINAFSGLDADPIVGNNRSVGTLVVKPTFTPDWSDDFEVNGSGWHNETYAGTTFFRIGTPSATAAYNGTQCAGYALTGFYSNNVHVALISPYIDLTSVAAADLEFMMWASLDDTYDGVIVEISTDNMTTWTQLDPTNAEGNYNAQLNVANAYLGGKWALCADTTGWVAKKFSLNAYCGNLTILRFRFASDSSINGNGWLIDAVSVKQPAAVDVGVSSITGLEGIRVNTPATLNITANNYGMSTETFDVYYQIEHPLGTIVNSGTHTFSGVPSAGYSSYEFQYTPSETGQYYVTAYTTLATDANAANNASSFAFRAIGVFNVPYFTDFGGDNSNWSTPGNPSWQFGVPTGAITPLDGACAAYNLTADYISYANVSLISPLFNLTSVPNAFLRFQMFCDFEDGYDGGTVEISTDYGATWLVLDSDNSEGNYDGTMTTSYGNPIGGLMSFYTTTTAWTQVQFDLSSYSGSIIQLRFRLGSDSSTNARGWFIDNVTIGVPAAGSDVGVSAITGAASTLVGDMETLNITASNFGSTAETFDVYYQIEHPVGTIVAFGTQSLIGLAPGASSSFDVQYTPTDAGQYYVSAYSMLAADTNNANNASSFTFSASEPSGVFSVPYFTGFDGDTNWTTAGTPTWQIGIPTAPIMPIDGICAGYNLTTTYALDSNASLISPQIDLTGVSNAFLSFQMLGDFEGTTDNYDGGVVEITTDGGATWVQLDPDNSEGNYDDIISSDYTNVLGGMWGFCYDTDWTEKKFDLSSYEGSVVQFRFRFGSDDAVSERGWFVDNVTVDVNLVLPTDAAVIEVNGSASGFMPLGVETHASVLVQNNGPSAATFNVTLEAINSTGASVWSGTTTVIGLANGANASAYFMVNVTGEPGEYRLHAFLTNPSDPVPSNNECNQTVYMMRMFKAPYFDDFETPTGNWSVTGSIEKWQIGSPYAYPAYSGSSCAGYNLTGLYKNGADCNLTSSFFDMTQAINGTLEFYLWSDFYGTSTADGMLIMVSVDGGAWEYLDPTNAQGQYNSTISGTVNPMHGIYAFTRDSLVWTKKTFNLGAYAGHIMQFKFRFATNAADVSNGTYVDDVKLTVPTGANVALGNISGPMIFVVNHTAQVLVSVSNVGAEACTFYLNCSMTNTTTGTTITASQVVSLAILETKIIAFNFTPTQFGLFEGGFFIDLPSDTNLSDNSRTGAVFVLPVYTNAFVDNFDTDLGWCTSHWDNKWEIGMPTWSGTIWGRCAGYNLTAGTYQNNDNTSLYMPIVNLSTISSPSLSFIYRMSVYGNYMDGGIIEYSLDYGVTWQQLDASNASGMYDGAIVSATSKIVGHQAFCLDTPGTAWKARTFDVSMLSGEVAFRFRFVSDASNYNSDGWLIDNVSIMPPGKELEVVSIAGPSFVKTGIAAGMNVTVKNNGGETQTFNLEVNVTNLASGAWTVTTVNVANLAYNETRIVPTSVTASENGWYSIVVTAILPGDVNITNNVATGRLLALPMYSVPYFEPFDNATVPYYHIGYLDSWDYGSPAPSGVTPHTGSYCIATNLSGNYANYEVSMMFMPIIDLTGLTSANLTFWMYGDFEMTSSRYDGGLLMISTDGGENWSAIDDDNSESNYDNTINSISNAFNGMYAFCYDTTGWEQKRFNLDAYCGGEIMIMFAFGSDYTGNAKGWYIDDIKISYQIPTDVGINSTILPSAIDCFIDTANITAEFCNFGTVAISGATATISITSSSGILEYWNQQALSTLQPGTSVLYSWYWAASHSGNFTVNITVSVAGDGDSSNDAYSGTITVKPFYSLHVNEEGYGNITSTQKTKVFVVTEMLTTETYYILSSYPRASSMTYRPMVSIYNETYALVMSSTWYFTFTPSYNGTYYIKVSNRTTEIVPFTIIVATRAGLKDLYANGQGYIIDNCSKTADPANFYIASLMAGTTYTINPQEADSVADIVAYYIYASNMTYFAYNDENTTTITPETDTTIIIIVAPYGSTYPDGMYNISISPLPAELAMLYATLNVTSASVLPGGVANFAITFTATGSAPVSVDVSIGSLIALWDFALSETTITVTPGTPYVVYLNVTPYTNAIADTYSVNVIANSEVMNHSLSPTVTILPVHSVSIALNPGTITATPGEEAAFVVELTSASNVWEAVNLTALAPAGWLPLLSPAPQVMVGPFGTASAYFTVTIPNGAPAGTSTVAVNASYSGLETSSSASVIVSGIYGLQLSVEGGKAASPGTQVRYNFTLNSTANCADTVDLSLDLPASWTIVTLSTPVSLPANAQSYSGYFVVSIPLGATPGANSMTLHAISRGNASIDVTRTITTTVMSLYGVSLDTPPSMMADPGQTISYTVNVTSNWADTILLTTSGLSTWSPTLSAASVSFDAAGTSAVTLTLTAPLTITQGNYNIVLTATSQNQSSLTSSVTITTIVLVSQYGVSLSQPLNVSTTAGVPVTYTFSVSSIGADTVIISTSGLGAWSPTLSATRLTFASAGAQTVTLTLTPPTSALGSYDITITATSENNTAKAASVVVRTTVNGLPASVNDVELTIGTSAYSLSPTAVEMLPIVLTIRNNGTVSDTITVTTTGLPAGWSATQGSVTLAAGATDTVTITVTVPANALAGVTTLTFTAASSNVSEKDMKTATITINRPDLTIVSVTVSPISPRVGDQVTINAIVSNGGSAAASNANVTIYVNNVPITTKPLGTLAAGQQTNITYTYAFTSDGTQTVKVVADATGTVIETNDLNNEGSTVVTVKKKASAPQRTILGMEESMAYIVFALIAALAIVMFAAIVVLTRRKKPPMQPEDQALVQPPQPPAEPQNAPQAPPMEQTPSGTPEPTEYQPNEQTQAPQMDQPQPPSPPTQN